MHRRFGKPKKKAPAKTLWAKRAGVFVLWTISMVFFCVGMSDAGLTAGDAFAYLGGWFTGWSPARFGAELYGAAYNGFYANTIMVAAYYAFVVVTLALGFALDARRAFTYKNKPSEICLANEKVELFHIAAYGVIIPIDLRRTQGSTAIPGVEGVGVLDLSVALQFNVPRHADGAKGGQVGIRLIEIRRACGGVSTPDEAPGTPFQVIVI